MLVSKFRSGTSKTKAGPVELVRVALFWKSHCATCSPACAILYHVTGSCKGPIVYENVKKNGYREFHHGSTLRETDIFTLPKISATEDFIAVSSVTRFLASPGPHFQINIELLQISTPFSN